jgi:predicted regulator of Ras-like GTPase activity (Roadblock/LC7/MglB family)
MDLTELLTGAVERVPGALAMSLLGVDGVAVETINGSKALPQPNGSRPRRRANPAWEVELAELMLSARRAARSLHWRGLRHITLETREYTCLARMINPDYFLLLVLENGANLGRARFELQRAGATLAQNL